MCCLICFKRQWILWPEGCVKKAGLISAFSDGRPAVRMGKVQELKNQKSGKCNRLESSPSNLEALRLMNRLAGRILGESE